ncbi:hypothetical protein PTSG_02241 [Salpingoeca rosetta]|uniref:Proteasome maturation protein n=1 Tax=Salpingoeca rosetta (strain ATCC 50818 / BSB-021) TaxID=946362 RepID=F2U1M0_SALR5|nr:uncharacterized protein PTSG_02241 [Salpingoeca rosetta]EGD81522.1 hypothetical protein PTSG_02241 [Salpingoeca rosetta]|eukprot:XP_004996726.1 hypothetical protein PTSG_02241 [Salpingoeca rosetta]
MSRHFPTIRPEGDAPLNTQPTSGPFGCHDTLRKGPTSARAEVAPKHPVEVAQAKHEAHHEKLKMSIMGAIQGPAAPQLVKLERAIYAQNQRLPSLHSSHLALDVSTGRLGVMDFDDFLNDPRDSEKMVDVHTAVEASPAFKR